MTSFYFKDDSTQAEKLAKRQALLQELRASSFANLFQTNFDVEHAGSKNCENLIGSVQVPVGVAGPVKFDFFANNNLSKKQTLEAIVPLATSEGALLASVSRGLKILNQAKSQVLVKKIGMSRSPVFACQNGLEAQQFAIYIDKNLNKIISLAEATSSHLKYLDHQIFIRGNLVFTRFVFDTQEAMGMNMVTIALQHAFNEILKANKKLAKIKLISISGNVCADKKDSVINRLLGRGCWAQAEVELPKDLIKKILKVDPKILFKTHQIKNLIGSNLAGSFSQNMQVANVVAAFYLATGQDMAHVVEGSQASLLIEEQVESLYFALTMPNINLGTVGGGTWLPAQMQARDLILKTKIKSVQLAGVLAITSLAAEISGLCALSTNTLASAHQKLARSSKK